MQFQSICRNALWVLPFVAVAQAQVKINSLPSGSVSAAYITICDNLVTTYSCSFSQIATWLGANLPSSLTSVNTVNGTAIPANATLLTSSSVPASQPALASNSSSQLIAATTTGSGAVVLASSAAVNNTAITGATIDNTTTADALLFTDLQASALVGTVPIANIPPSNVRYSASSTCIISSTDGGNVVTTTYTGALATCTIPDINTSGINPNAFQMALFNYDTNEMLLTQTSTTTINNLPSIPFVPGAAAILFADNGNSGSGVYNYDALIVGESVGPQPMYLWHDTAQSGTNISDWGAGTISGTNGEFCIYALKDGGYSPGFASGGTSILCATRGASGTATGQGVTAISIGNATSNTAVTFPSPITVSFSGAVKTPALIVNGATACSTTGQSCIYQPSGNQLAFGGVPGGTATQYAFFDAYGNLSVIGDIVALGSPPTLTPTSGCTALSTPVGGARAFSFSPTTTSGGVCAFTVTWTSGQANSVTNGWVCNGSDNGQGTTLFQTNAANHTTFVTMKTGSTTATTDLIVVHCDSF